MRIGAWLVALALLVMVSTVMAASPVGVSTPQEQPQYDTANANNSASNIQGGRVYNVDLEMYRTASSWAGIYGKITEKIVLGSGTHKFFEWDVSSAALPGYIYITYNNDIDWTTVQAPTDASEFATVLQSELTGWTAGDESVGDTFNQSDDCGTGTDTIAAYVYGDYDGDDTISPEWPVCAYKARNSGDTEDRVVYAAAVKDNGTAYDGTTGINYQAIVAALSGGTTVYFFKG